MADVASETVAERTVNPSGDRMGHDYAFQFGSRRTTSEIQALTAAASATVEMKPSSGKPSATRKVSDTVLRMVSGLPYQVYLELVHCLNAPTDNHNDWKTLAARLGLTTDEVLSFDEEGKRTSAVLHFMSNHDLETAELVKHLVAMERHDALSILAQNGVRLNHDDPPSHGWAGRGGRWPRVFLGSRRSLSSDELLVHKPTTFGTGTQEPPLMKRKSLFQNRPTQWTPKTESVVEVREGVPSPSAMDTGKKLTLLDDIERYALVIAVGRYTLPDLQLALPERDAAKIAARLSELDWQVESLVNYSHQQMHCAISEFCKRTQNHVAMIYYCGHAVQIDGANYLLPADIPTLSSPATVMHHSVNLSQVVEGLSDCLMKLIIVHAGHPLPRWPGLIGLASMMLYPRTCVVFSSPPGQTNHVIASSSSNVSPFASAFLRSLAVADLPLRKLLTGMSHSLADPRGSHSPLAVFGQGVCQLPLLINSRLKHGVDGVIRPGHAPPGYALIIGNSTYKSCPLDYPSSHATELAESLQNHHWTVECLTNLTGKALTAAICGFVGKLQAVQMGGGAVMVVFCGYATQTVDGTFLMGTDLTTHCQEDGLPWLPASVPVEWLLDVLAENVTGPKVLCLDACWDCKLLPVVHRLDMPPIPASSMVALSNVTKYAPSSPRLSSTLADNLTNLPHCSLLSLFSTLRGCHVESELFFA